MPDDKLTLCSERRLRELVEAESKLESTLSRLAASEAVCRELKGSAPSDIVGSEGVRLLAVWKKLKDGK